MLSNYYFYIKFCEKMTVLNLGQPVNKNYVSMCIKLYVFLLFELLTNILKVLGIYILNEKK